MTYSEDFAVNVGDLVQVYTMGTASYNSYIYDFKISVAENPAYCVINM